MAHIGIDLGTTNALIAVFEEDGPRLIKNSLGEVLTPSVISLDGDRLLSGAVAKARQITHPKQTAALFKRAMGTEKQFRLGRKSFSAVDLSAALLTRLKQDAEADLGEPVSDVIISVPAYFNEIQRSAVKQAAELAGLTPLRLINEPTAAALAYGLHDINTESTFLVFDLGGGTFDVSILEMFEGVMEVKATAGDAFLGGEDVTEALYEHLLAQYPADNPSLQVRSILKKLADQAKLGLTDKHHVTIETAIDGKDFRCEIARTDLEAMTADLQRRLRLPIERALYDAKLSMAELDRVILVGGATRMPVIRSLIAKQLQMFPESKLNPDHVVALGAAVQAGLVGKNKALDDVVMTDVSAFTLGIETSRKVGASRKAGYFMPIIERNSVIPISKSHSVQTVEYGQTRLEINVFQGEAPLVTSNIFLGTLMVDIPHNRETHESADVRFTYDTSGLLDVDVTVHSTGETRNLLIKSLMPKARHKDIEAILTAMTPLKVHPRDVDENKLTIERLSQCYAMAREIDRSMIQDMIAEFDAALDAQDPGEIERQAKTIHEILNRFESNYVN